MTETPVATPERGPAKDAARQGLLGRLAALLSRLGLYYRQVVAELRKVIWPTRNELVSYTWIVLIFVAIMIAFVSLADYLFSKGVLEIFG